ncbi:DnaB-like helicase C-terminal domain-containing protein [Ancylobacter sp. WKF20]|uniref:DnaB-like helicase C-terminal domain-containing protein n=1 Tax=Ancylobacter sp. WKF20 TaxID=3039801 RepID=UPI0024342A8A|nr:DnaB-like helicase C-terminal domain-containing protein [Ancylobacter sp. WKF20]WGD31676.1 DnaB-like helicase C-terminal domain-containing protein [Ancylobacter sp. WKF20]
MIREESSFIGKEPCPACGSRDNLGRYSDGHGHCFGCGYYEPGDGSAPRQPNDNRSERLNADLIRGGDIAALPKRKLTEETCRKFGYRLGEYKGKPVQIAPFYDSDRNEVAQKLRFANKDFKVLGDLKEAGLFGQHLWGQGGKKVVVTEGEIDALTVSQLQGNKWPVVSVPNGAQGALKSIKKNLEWLETFEQVVFMFDMDEPGLKASAECAAALSPGKAAVASLPLKDPSECLQAGKGEAVITAIWNAKVYRPDGIVSGSEITLEMLRQTVTNGFALPYPKLNEMLGGLRKRELTLLTAGSGIGKSTLARELAYHLHQAHGCTIGSVYLEESKEKTAQGYIAIHNDVPLGKLRADPSCIPETAWGESLKNIIQTRMFFYDHFGSLDSENLLSKLRYLAVSCGVDFIILDHISIVVSGQESSSEGERKDIDRLMTKLRSLVEETGVGVIAIVHLNKPEGSAHEEGGRVTLSHLRGSGSLKQLSDNVLALERDQQGETPSVSMMRLLKNREFGEVGPADHVRYDKFTGRLLPHDPEGAFMDESGADDVPF